MKEKNPKTPQQVIEESAKSSNKSAADFLLFCLEKQQKGSKLIEKDSLYDIEKDPDYNIFLNIAKDLNLDVFKNLKYYPGEKLDLGEMAAELNDLIYRNKLQYDNRMNLIKYINEAIMRMSLSELEEVKLFVDKTQENLIEKSEIHSSYEKTTNNRLPMEADFNKIEKYESKSNKESVPDFIQRVYGGWLSGEFTRADLRKIDPKAEMALRNWERKNGRAPLNLPTKKELNDRRLAEPDDAVDKHERLDRQRLRAARRQNAKRLAAP